MSLGTWFSRLGHSRAVTLLLLLVWLAAAGSCLAAGGYLGLQVLVYKAAPHCRTAVFGSNCVGAGGGVISSVTLNAANGDGSSDTSTVVYGAGLAGRSEVFDGDITYPSGTAVQVTTWHGAIATMTIGTTELDSDDAPAPLIPLAVGGIGLALLVGWFGMGLGRLRRAFSGPAPVDPGDAVATDGRSPEHGQPDAAADGPGEPPEVRVAQQSPVDTAPDA